MVELAQISGSGLQGWVEIDNESSFFYFVSYHVSATAPLG